MDTLMKLSFSTDEQRCKAAAQILVDGTLTVKLPGCVAGQDAPAQRASLKAASVPPAVAKPAVRANRRFGTLLRRFRRAASGAKKGGNNSGKRCRGEAIRYARLARQVMVDRGLSARTLAEAMHVTPDAVLRWLRAEVRPIRRRVIELRGMLDKVNVG